MLYDVSVRFTHEYLALAVAGRHLLRLLPADIPGRQRVIASTLSVEPRPAERIDRIDYFGNACVEIAFRDPLALTDFHMTARVKTLEPQSLLDMSPDLEGLAYELAGVLSLDARSPHNFVTASTRVPEVPAISDWASAIMDPGKTTLANAIAVCRAINEEMIFDPDATAVDTPAAEAFLLKRGVCQDFTHIAISALRSLGIPAGYVSGLLRTIPPEGKERLEGADAMHAWVRFWCGIDTGWVEYDPTNIMFAGEDHLVIAYGRDYFDVAPVKGMMRSSGDQEATQAVDVIAIGT